MADNSTLVHIGADVSDLKKATEELKTQFSAMEKAATSTFNNADDVINKVTSALEGQLKELKNLTGAWKDMGKSQTDAITSRLDTMISKMGNGLNSAGNSASRTGDKMSEMASKGTKAMRTLRDEQTMLQKGFEYLKWTVTRVFFFGAVLKFGDAIKGVVREGKAWEKQVSALSTLTNGDLGGARSIYNMIGDIANKIPYEVDEIVKASLTLNKTGLKPTESLLMSIAKIASGTNQSLFTQATALSSVVTGNLRGLRQMGITAKDNGNTLSLTFQGETQEIQKTNKALVAYIENLANTKFNSALDMQMNSLTGKTKVLSEKWAEFSRAIYFNGGSTIVSDFITGLTDKISKLIGWLNKPETLDTISRFWEALKEPYRVIETMIGTIKNGFDSLLKVGNTVFGSLFDTTEQTTNGMKGMFGSFGDFCISILNNISAAAKAIFQWIDDVRESSSSFAVRTGITENLALATKETVDQYKGDAEKIKKAKEEYTKSLILSSSYADEYNKINQENKNLQDILIKEYKEANISEKEKGELIDIANTTIKENQKKLQDIRRDVISNNRTFEEVQQAMTEGDFGLFGGVTQDEIKAWNAGATSMDAVGLNEKLNDKNNRFKDHGGQLDVGGVLDNFKNAKKELEDKQKEIADARVKLKKEQEEAEKKLNDLKTGTTQTGDGQSTDIFGTSSNSVANAKSKIKEVRDTWTEYYNHLIDSNIKYSDRYTQLQIETNSKIAELEQKANENSFVTAEMKAQALLEIERDYNEQLKELKLDAYEFIGSLDEENSDLIKLEVENQNKLKMLEQYHNEALLSEEQYQKALEELRKNYYKKSSEVQIAKQVKPYKEMSSALKEVSDGLKDLTSNLDENSSAYRVAFSLQKSFAVATATTNAMVAWTEALKGPHATWYEGLAKYASAVALTTNILTQLSSITMHDKGGNIPTGGLGIVGEYGPELVSGPANVTSRKKTEDLLSNSKSNITVNLIEDSSRAGQVNKQDTDEETIINVIVANIRNGGDVDGAIAGTYNLSRVGA